MTRPTFRDLVVVPRPRPAAWSIGVGFSRPGPSTCRRRNRQDPRAAVLGPDYHPATKCLPSKTDALHIRTRSDSRLDRLAAAAALPRMSFHGITPLIRSRRSESWREHMRRDGCALHANDCAPVLLLHAEYPRARSCRRLWKPLLEANLRVGSRPAKQRSEFRLVA